MESGCPKCPLSLSIESMKEKVRREVAMRLCRSRLYPIWDIDVSLEEVTDAYSIACSALPGENERLDGDLDETVAGLVKVVLSEREQVRAGDAFDARPSK